MIGILLLPIALLLLAQLGILLCKPIRATVGRSERNLRTIRGLKRAALVVLGLGILMGTTLYFSAVPDEPVDPDLQADTLSMSHRTSKKAQAEMERVGGKANVEIANFLDWFAALWHGRVLGVTLMVVAVLVALILFLVARSLH